jgi:dTDP-D-glucose 4,6-dehydratase
MYAGLDLPIHGDGMSTRSYLYVEDVADAYCLILHKVRRPSVCLVW